MSDGFCDDQNNNVACNFDEGDCPVGGSSNFEKSVRFIIKYYHFILDDCNLDWFNDGVCDIKNDKEECHFDGGDCPGMTINRLIAFRFSLAGSLFHCYYVLV